MSGEDLGGCVDKGWRLVVGAYIRVKIGLCVGCECGWALELDFWKE